MSGGSLSGRAMTNFRLSGEAREILAALSSDWRMSKRGVIEKLLFDADPRGGVHVVPDEAEMSTRLEGPLLASTVHTVSPESVPKKALAADKGAGKSIPEPAKSRVVVLTREEREARMAAAQGWLGKKK